jgi:putative transposase
MTKCAGKAGVIDLKGLLARDEDFVRAAVEGLMQAALEAEMTEAIGAGKGERTETRLSYRSGYYGRSLITRVGTLELRVPQDRLGRFSTELFERYQRSEKALVGTLAEMYVQGVSTRKVKGNRGIVRAQLLGLGDQRDQQVPRPEPACLCRAAAR